jgi:hypothetical protein
MTDEILDWKQICAALKHGAIFRANHYGVYWLEIPIDANAAQQIISHPAVVPSDESDRYETYRWRSQSESPARTALKGSVS